MKYRINRQHSIIVDDVSIDTSDCSFSPSSWYRVGHTARGRGHPARGRVGRVMDCGVRGLGFKSPGSILTSRTEITSLSRVVRDGGDPCSVPLNG